MQTPRLARCFQTKNEIKERNERRRTFIRRRKIQQNKRDWDKGQGKNQINERILLIKSLWPSDSWYLRIKIRKPSLH